MIRAWILIAALLPGVPSLRAGGFTVELKEYAGYEVETGFTLAVDTTTAQGVLSDYEGIPGFISAVKESRVTEREEGSLLLSQEMEGRAYLFSLRIRLLLRVREPAPGVITFEDVSGRDFEWYEGRWDVAPGPEGTTVRYRLRARPLVSAPGFIKRGAFRKGVRELMEDVRREMLRRSGR